MTSPPGFESNPTLRNMIARITNNIESLMEALQGHLECEQLCSDLFTANAITDSLNDYSLLLIMAKIIEDRATEMLTTRTQSEQN
jgi:hypothetical protein